jgi:linoleoyl-CoA desaturase
MSPDSPSRTVEAVRTSHAAASTDRLKFNGDNTFQRELRRRVEAYFKQSGQSQRDGAKIYLKTALILAAFVASYVLLVFFAATWWQGVLLSIALGVATAQIGFNIMHDAGHQAFSEHRRVNKWMAMTLDLVGGSSYVWHWKHAHFHHTNTNIDGYDSDINLGALARFAPQQKHYWHHRWQHIYLWMLYGLTVVSWHLHDDFRDVITGTIGKRRFPRPKGKDLAVFVIGKLVFFTLALGLPLIFHSVSAVLLCYGLVAVVAGLQLALVFQLAHAVEEAAFPQPSEPGHMNTPWAIHQLQTTANFSRDNRLVTWLVGGLNFQIEHHLFPRICHVHYPAISRVVEATCREYGVPYHANASFGAGLASHYRWLKRMGQPEALAATVVLDPLPQN